MNAQEMADALRRHKANKTDSTPLTATKPKRRRRRSADEPPRATGRRRTVSPQWTDSDLASLYARHKRGASLTSLTDNDSQRIQLSREFKRRKWVVYDRYGRATG